MKEPLIGILMATYNGEKYISQQIDSILNQTYRNWQLLIHDDGSTDKTVEIVKNYVKEYPDKILLIEDGIKCGGPKENFSHLIQIARKNFNFDYIMFSDQDDVWLPNKIEITFRKMQKVEKRCKANLPLLIHTDLKVVDEKLHVISNSFWDYQKINPYNNSLNCLILENVVTGCTMMFNKTLLSFVKYIPKNAILHDWWITLICSIVGKIHPLHETTVLYRQHSQNHTGAKGSSLINLFYRVLKDHNSFIKEKRVLSQKIRLQIYELYKFASSLPNDYKYKNYINFLEKYIETNGSFVSRKLFYIRKNCLCGNIFKKIGKLVFY